MKVTDLRLVDGDGIQMLGKLATHLADQGRELKQDGGDIIRLDLKTEFTHKINESTEKMPLVFILKYSVVGSSNAPPGVVTVHNPRCCATTHPDIPSPRKKTKTADVSDEIVDCCPTNRYCSCHGTSFVVCVCDAIPVEDLDLELVKEDCYFATDEFKDMPNPHKRNMLYWWYATNVYSICGKGK